MRPSSDRARAPCHAGTQRLEVTRGADNRSVGTPTPRCFQQFAGPNGQKCQEAPLLKRRLYCLPSERQTSDGPGCRTHDNVKTPADAPRESVPVPNQSYSMWILPCPGMRSSHFCEVVVVALPLSAASMPSDPYHERMLASCASGPKRQSTGSNVRECETSTTESGKQPCAHPRAVA